MKFLIAAVLLLSLSCSHTPDAPLPAPKRSLVFVHGSHFDASAWDQVAPEFAQNSNYQVTLITLPGRQENENPTLKEMATAVCEKIPAASTMIVHSFGGVVTNQMVGICPEKIQSIVYVTALVPLNGEKPFDLGSKADQKTFTKAVQFRKDRIVPRDQNTFLKAMDSTLDLKSLPALHFFTESYKPGEEKLDFDLAKFNAIPKSYIYAIKDSVVGIKTQKKYTKRTAMVKTESVASGHLPMLSKPKELIEAIKKVL